MKLSETIAINDRIKATGATEDEILEGVVTALDDDMEMVFFTTTEGEEVMVTATQVTDNFGPAAEKGYNEK